MTSAALYNLQRIDELGAVFKLDATSSVNVSSALDINIRANSPLAGGTGLGGTVRIGIPSQLADNFLIHAKQVSLAGTESFNLGTAALVGDYRIPWPNIDTTLGTVASFPDFNQAVANVPAISTLVEHPSRQDNPHGVTPRQIGTYSAAEIDALLAAKSNLLMLTDHMEAKSGVHGLSGDVVGTTDAQRLVNKQINATENQLREIGNAAIASDAAIDGFKINPTFGNQEISTLNQLKLHGLAYFTALKASQANQTSNLIFSLPSGYGSNGQVLTTDGEGNLSWQSAGGSANIVQETYTWTHAEGKEKYVTHGFNNQNLDITIKDMESNELIFVPDLNIVDNHTIHIVSSETPAIAWQIIIQGVAR